MKDEDFIGNRALNDYTADKANYKKEKKFVEPKKVDMYLGSWGPMHVIEKKK